MKEISLTKGKVALVDDADYEFLSRFKWCAHAITNTFYASRRPTKLFKHELMHRAILSPISKGLEVDHIDGNGLNNQRSNLRLVTRRVNQQNLHIKKASRFPGVCWHNIGKKWVAKMKIGKKTKYLGLYTTEEEAFHAYVTACEQLEKGELPKCQ